MAPAKAFPALIQARIDADGLPYAVRTAAEGGARTHGAAARLDSLRSERVAILVVELGINDAFRGIAVRHIRANLESLTSRARSYWPQVRILLLGMRAPRGLSTDYRRGFESLYRDLADAEGVQLADWVLEGVAEVPEMNLHDGLHPNERGHLRIAENLWPHLEPLLRACSREAGSQECVR